jgi:hypothetical protein
MADQADYVAGKALLRTAFITSCELGGFGPRHAHPSGADGFDRRSISGSGPAGRPALVDLVVEPHDLAVLELECVGEGGVKVRATLVLAREAARDHDRIAPVIEVLGAADELVEVLRYRGEYQLAHR